MIGIYYRKKATSSLDGYYKANGSFGIVLGALAAFAAFCSGGSILGGAGFAYNYGIAYTWSCNIGSCLGFILAAVLVAPYLRAMELTTVADYFMVRYQWKKITIAAGVIVVVAFGAYLVSQFKGAALAAQFLLGWNYEVSLLVVAFIYILYVSIGGMWAVTMTDAVQSVLMLIAMTVLSIACIINNGGFMPMMSDAIENLPFFAVNSLGGVSLIGFCILWAAAACCLPHMVMRMTSSKSVKVARRTFGWCGILYGFFALCFVGVAAAAIIVCPPGTDSALPDSDMAFLVTMDMYFGPLLKGFAAAAVMAAIMSTTDSLLLSVSAAFSNDIVKTLAPDTPDRKLIRIGGVVVWVVGIISALIALNPPSLMGLLYSNAVGMMTAGFFWPLVLGIWWKNGNKYGTLCSLIFGSGVYLVMAGFSMFGVVSYPLFAEICVTLPLSLVAYVIGSKATAKKITEDGGAVMDMVHEKASFI